MVDGVAILVGNRGLLGDYSIEVPSNFAASGDTSSEVFVAREFHAGKMMFPPDAS